MKVYRTSPLTGKTNMMDLPVTQAQLDEMDLPGPQRRLVQDIFPDLSNNEREFIKTGYTQADWDAMFPEEDEEAPACVVCGVPLPGDCEDGDVCEDCPSPNGDE